MNACESHLLEWKESWRDDFLKVLCGFANAEGGVLQIGRNDAGHPVKFKDAPRLLEDLPNKIRDVLGILPEIKLIEEKGSSIIEVRVPAYPAPINCRGHYYQRVGSTTQELKGAALDRFLLRRQGRTWDSVPLPGIFLPDLDNREIALFRKHAKSSGRLSSAMLAENDEVLLNKLQLTEGHYLKRAAALLFHEDPERFFTGAFVKIGFFRSESELLYHDLVQGSLLSQVRQTLDLLLTKYLKAAISYQGIQRIERFPIPPEALREVILNAMVHRDYQTPAPVQIRVYPDLEDLESSRPTGRVDR